MWTAEYDVKIANRLLLDAKLLDLQPLNDNTQVLDSFKSTGWPFRLCWHENKGCILVYGPYTKMKPLIWFQQNLDGHPVVNA